MKYYAKPVEVHAFAIERIVGPDAEGGYDVYILREQSPFYATPAMCARMTPKVGDYWVIQADGYAYLNPKDIFERKYGKDQPLTLNYLTERCYNQAKEKGWHEKPVPVPEQVALLCSEACEALEAYRNKEPIAWIDDKGKPQGIGPEFADILIRLGHYAQINGVNLEEVVLEKLAYNATRPHRHGGKLC